MGIIMGAESIRPKIIKEAESVRLGAIIEDDSIRISVDMRANAVHLNDVTETESAILTAITETEILRGMLCSMRRHRGPTPVSTYVWCIYEFPCRVAVNALSRCYS